MNRKIHITLVGGQTMPVYLGIKYAKPELVVFICSGDSEKKISPIEGLLGDVDSEKKEFDTSDFQKIENATQDCFKQYSDDEVSINLSGGLKPWTYYFIRKFIPHKNVKMFYVDQNCIVHDFETKEEQQLEISIEEQLSLTEANMLSHKSVNNYTDEDFEVIEQIMDIRKDGRLLRSFNELTEIMSKHKEQTIVRSSDNSTLEWSKKKKLFTLSTRNGVFELTSPNVRHLVLNAGWFEIMVSYMLSSWSRCKEIWTNCIFGSKTNAETTNEIDIIVNIGNKLLFVECKTQIYAPTDIDKFNSVVKKNGGNGSKALFVTYESMNETNQNTCGKYNILPFSFKSKNSKNIKTKESLYELLDSVIFKNNL